MLEDGQLPPNIYEKPTIIIYISSKVQMGSLSKAIILSLLLVLLYSQSTNTVYTLNGQTYTYIYGSGATDGSSVQRTHADQDTYVADSTLIPVDQTVHRATINCPQHQVYNNILCECVCILGYYMKNGACYANNPLNPVCGKN